MTPRRAVVLLLVLGGCSSVAWAQTTDVAGLASAGTVTGSAALLVSAIIGYLQWQRARTEQHDAQRREQERSATVSRIVREEVDRRLQLAELERAKAEKTEAEAEAARIKAAVTDALAPALSALAEIRVDMRGQAGTIADHERRLTVLEAQRQALEQVSATLTRVEAMVARTAAGSHHG